MDRLKLPFREFIEIADGFCIRLYLIVFQLALNGKMAILMYEKIY